MANEYLKRTPTSTGNRKVWTWSGWVKRNQISSDSFVFSAGSQANNWAGIHLNATRGVGLLDVVSGSVPLQVQTIEARRDASSWLNVVVSVDTTKENSQDRVRMYVDGVNLTKFQTHITVQNDNTWFNSLTMHGVGRLYDGANPFATESEMFDLFFVDGQALTPDVFGFYKDGDGYVSAGSTMSTDFKPGQWSPHTPRKIKSDIERRGGFGVNGFYLPMNDSSNPGADFHTTPNSIIKLKGEDLPQPRNGAPTTSDAYVSQLRQEAGTLGFDGAVKFDGNDYLSIPKTSFQMLHKLTSSWTVEGYIFKTSDSQGTLFDTGGSSGATIGTAVYINSGGDLRLRVRQALSGTVVSQNFPGSVSLNRWQHIAISYDGTSIRVFVEGKIIGTISYNTQSSTDSTQNFSIGVYDAGGGGGLAGYFTGFISNLRVIDGTALYTSNFTVPTEALTNVTNTKLLCCNSSSSVTASTVTPGTITANGNAFATRNELTGSIVLAVPGIAGGQGSGYGDYSADIKGSGSNKSITANGSAGVIATPSYYGSAIDFSGTSTSDYLEIAHSEDFNFGSGDFTIECWRYLNSFNAGGTYLAKFDGTSSTSDFFFAGQGSGVESFYWYDSGVNNISSSSIASLNQWDHVAACREGNKISLFVNGVCVAVNNNVTASFNNNTEVVRSGADASGSYKMDGYIQDLRVYKGVAKYKGGFDVQKPYTPVGIEEFRTVSDTCKNNFTTLNPIFGIGRQNQLSYAEGNLKVVSSATSGSDTTATSNMAIKGKIYCEFSLPDEAIGCYVGIMKYNTSLTNNGIDTTNNTNCWIMRGDNGNKANGEGVNGVSYGGAFSDGDIIMMAVDIDNGSIWWGRNGTWNASGNPSSNSNAAYTNLPSDEDLLTICGDNYSTKTPTIIANYGQNPTFGNRFALNKNRINSSTANSVWHQSSNTGTHTDWTVSSGGTELDVAVPSGHYARVKLRSADGTIDLKKKYLLSFKYTTGPANLGVQNDQGYMTAVDGSVSPNGLSSGNFYSFVVHGSSEITITGFTGSTYALDNVIVSEIDECYTDDSGKGKFHYQPPTGFLALCEDNLPAPAISNPGKHFKTVLWTGDGNSGRSITGVGFQPDLVWVKSRTSTVQHYFTDVIRGVGNSLASNSTADESSSTTWLQSFDSNGFSIGSSGGWNGSGNNYVGWCWKAGGTSVSNSDGSITSQVSANQDAGFSIVSYTGNQTSGATVGHGLGKTPKLFIVKERGNTNNWTVYHHSLGNTKVLYLDLTNDQGGNFTGAWNNTSPTSSVFSLGNSVETNRSSGTFIAYCWTEIEGYSKFGTYEGSGNADGPFVYCGFKPAFILVKSSTNSSNWLIMDNARNSKNPVDLDLYANLTNTETEYARFDYVSNGFKVRNTSGEMNTDGATYIFMAFAESPFQTANAK